MTEKVEDKIKKNMLIYNAGKEVSKDALKSITFGRMKGKTSIDPMWRIKKMTEIFGAKGIGWKTKKIKEDFYKDESTGETIYTIEIELYYKIDDEWSEAVEGVGSHYMFKKEKNSLHFNDEFKKMARTDAEGNAMKSLGIGANVYMGLCDGDKYQNGYNENENGNNTSNKYQNNYNKTSNKKNDYINDAQQKLIFGKIMNTSFIEKNKENGYQILLNITGQNKPDYTTKAHLDKFLEYIESVEKQDIQLLRTNLINKLTNKFGNDKKSIEDIMIKSIKKVVKVSEMSKIQIALVDTKIK